MLAWPAATAAVIFGTVVAFRLLAHGWASRHAPAVAAVALLEAYAALILVLAAAFGGPAGIRDRLGFRYTTWWHLALAIGVWICSLAVGGMTTLLFTPLLGSPRSNATDTLKISADPLFIAIVVPTVTLLAPFGEELLFRGALYGWMRRRIPVVAAMAATATLFAALHLIPTLLPLLFVFGVAAALVYEYTGSTLNSFLMHATQNTVAVVAAYAALSSGVTR